MKPQKQENIKLNWGNEKTWRMMNSQIPIRAQMAERYNRLKLKLEKVRRDIEKKSPFMNVKLAKIVPCVQNVQKRKKETINE